MAAVAGFDVTSLTRSIVSGFRHAAANAALAEEATMDDV